MNRKLPSAPDEAEEIVSVFGPKMKVRETGRVGRLKDHTTGANAADLGYILEFSDGQSTSFRRDEVDYAL